MCGASFIDMIMVVVKFFLQVQNMTTQSSSTRSSTESSSQWWIDFISEWRDTIAFTMPNVAVKRALFNLKIQSLPQCKLLLNAIAISSSSPSSSLNTANKTVDLINKHKSLSILTDNSSSGDWQSKGFDWDEPGIGKFILMSWSLTACGCLLIALVEMQFFSWSLVIGKRIVSFVFKKSTYNQEHLNLVIRFLIFLISI